MKFNAELGMRIIKAIEAIMPDGTSFWKAADEDCGFDEFYGANEYGEFLTRTDIMNAIMKVDPMATIDNGCSKMVIISPNLGDVVLKIPFRGIIVLESYTFRPFKDAPYDCEWNYCESECIIYNMLKELDLIQYVAETAFFTKLGDIPCYVQEAVIKESDIDDTFHKISINSMNSAETIQNDVFVLHDISVSWLGLCIDFYGEKSLQQFITLLKDIKGCGFYIGSDLHDNNYGERIDGTPCILDFSGFFDVTCFDYLE